MPELPDIEVYLEALAARALGAELISVALLSPFVLRSVTPPVSAAVGMRVTGLRRLGKRVVFAFEGGLFLVIHLMVAGRFKWKASGAKTGAGRIGLAAFEFSTGTLLLTEAGSKKRAGIWIVEGEDALRAHDPAGLEVLSASFDQFLEVLQRENHTLKRSLTDPHLFSGIGNAYSDEILHRAKLSPFVLTSRIARADAERLYDAIRLTLIEWTARLRAEAGDKFPEKVTAFRPEMAVHGRYNQPCPVCDTPVQRIVYAENESNYCPTCQTGGRLLADRALSQLLKGDWPRTLEELEARKRS
ncbi:MAG: DNA-formamidopyrimidine glycosylase family protein [Acidobacteriota bacterium]